MSTGKLLLHSGLSNNKLYRSYLQIILLLFSVSSVLSAEIQQQTLDQQNNGLFESSLNSESDHITKDLDKRTIFGPQPHIYLGKHVGIKPTGHKYLLGYNTLDLRYKAPVRHFKVFKPIPVRVHYHAKPVLHLKPGRQYLPVNIHSNLWRPVIKLPKPVIPVTPAVEPPFISLLPPKTVPAVSVNPEVPLPSPSLTSIPTHVPAPPVLAAPLPVLPVPAPITAPEPPNYHHFVFQTPVSRPTPPQFHHVIKPQLEVLPLGASFPVPILPPTAPVSSPASHSLQVHYHTPLPAPIASVPRPVDFSPHAIHPHNIPPQTSYRDVTLPIHSEVFKPQILSVPDVTYHGVPNLNPLNKPTFFSNEFPLSQPEQIPTPHVEPPNVQQFHQQLKEVDQRYNYDQSGYGFNYSPNNLSQEFERLGPGIQPGQTDLQFPLSLPEHLTFRPQDIQQQSLQLDQHHSNPYHTVTYQTHGNLGAFQSQVNNHHASLQRKGDEEEGVSSEMETYEAPFKPSQKLSTPIDWNNELNGNEEK